VADIQFAHAHLCYDSISTYRILYFLGTGYFTQENVYKHLMQLKNSAIYANYI